MRTGYVFYRQNGADANINAIKIGQRDRRLDRGGGEYLIRVHGLLPVSINPVFSSSPNIKFMFCTAWPAAPLTRLSIAVKTTICRPRAANPMSQKFVFFTQLMSGLPSTSRTKNESR